MPIYIVGVIPVVFIFLIWFVAVPACVVERLGPIRSLARSSALTAGYRWKLLPILLLLLLPYYWVDIARELPPFAGSVVYLVVASILKVVFYAFEGVVTAVAYHDLRLAKEGADIEKITAVFD